MRRYGPTSHVRDDPSSMLRIRWRALPQLVRRIISAQSQSGIVLELASRCDGLVPWDLMRLARDYMNKRVSRNKSARSRMEKLAAVSAISAPVHVTRLPIARPSS